jgi:DNA (cytosine-5)-methyltransferase 1
MRPRLLDLFCGAGGAGKGYADAGFEVVGVDITYQPNYPFEFIEADALTYLEHAWVGANFEAVHASPPCQARSAGRHMPRTGEHEDLIPETRRLLEHHDLPYVIENVIGAALVGPTMVCGTSLGLGADGHHLARHRLFETNWPMPLFTVPPCCCGGRPVLGIYGDRAKTSRGASLAERSSRWSRPESLAVGGEAMGIDWMTWRELREAIPPAYTELIGHQLMQHIARAPVSPVELRTGG